MFKLFLLFLVVPVLEIYLIIKVGSVIGDLPTAALLLALSLAGAFLVRSQGFRILNQVRGELAQGRLPGAQLLDGVLILLGGLLLVLPGFCTDVIGIFFLIPATRRVIKLWLGLWLQSRLARGGFLVRRTY